MREEFLAIYECNIDREIVPLPRNKLELLETMGARGLRWGIVTNKAERLARLLLEKLKMGVLAPAASSAATRTPNPKPHPEPCLRRPRARRRRVNAFTWATTCATCRPDMPQE